MLGSLQWAEGRSAGAARRAGRRGVWVEPYPDEMLEVEDGYASPDASYEEREAVELAFIAAMQHLPRGAGGTGRLSQTDNSRSALIPGWSRRKRTFRSPSMCSLWRVIGSRK